MTALSMNIITFLVEAWLCLPRCRVTLKYHVLYVAENSEMMSGDKMYCLHEQNVLSLEFDLIQLFSNSSKNVVAVGKGFDFISTFNSIK